LNLAAPRSIWSRGERKWQAPRDSIVGIID
jgi:hypothetical protein